jgi:ParB-like chromosome segregation protein Spo0J
MIFDISEIEKLPIEEKIQRINQIKIALHKISPHCSEPVDCVVWVKSELVQSNHYNPNSVAPPEMKLLEQSILQDGYTQPIVGWELGEEKIEVVDGFHRNRIGKECVEVRGRTLGYLPMVIINDDRQDVSDRMVSTIRHNRARGKHGVDSMSDIVVELKKRNWSDEKIQKQLGMDKDEVLRLCQISGLTELFAGADYSMSWEVDDFGEDDEDLEFEEDREDE